MNHDFRIVENWRLRYLGEINSSQEPASACARADPAPRAGEVRCRAKIDVEISTTDGRTILLTRYTEPEPELKLPWAISASAPENSTPMDRKPYYRRYRSNSLR